MTPSAPFFGRDTLLILLLSLAVVLGVLLFERFRQAPTPPSEPPAEPPVAPAPVPDRPLSHYLPLSDGLAERLSQVATNGETLLWRSTNLELLPTGPALVGRLPPTTHAALVALYPTVLTEALPDVQLFRVHTREIVPAGLMSESVWTLLRDEAGQRVLGVHAPESDQEIVFTPPLPDLPATLGPQSAWAQSGSFSTGEHYTITGQVLATGPFTHTLGTSDDCVQVDYRFRLMGSLSGGHDTHAHQWYCAGLGLVENQFFTPEGEPWSALRLFAQSTAPISVRDRPSIPNGFPPTVALGEDPTNWILTRVGPQQAQEGQASRLGAAWLRATTPLVTVAEGGDLVAYHGLDPQTVLWRFHPAAPLSTLPSFEEARETMVFGTEDHRLYALNGQGFFLWAFEAGGAIGQPLAYEPSLPTTGEIVFIQLTTPP